MLDSIEAINAFIGGNAAAPWALGVVFLLATFDAAIPPLPSEPVIMTMAAFGAANAAPNLAVLATVAASGAWLGDNLIYTLARHSPLRGIRHAPWPRLRRAFQFASHELEGRGGVVIIVARYIPVGRVAVNVTAGASEFRRPRFMGLSAVATVTWAVYSVAIGALAGTWVKENPLLGALGGIVVAVLLGLVADHIIRRLTTRPAGPERVECAESAASQPVECAESAVDL